MPTYEYECRSCEHRFEVFQGITEDAIDTCPKCGESVRRLIGGGAGIIFKGSGFYVTDSRSSSSGGSAKKEKQESGSEKSGDSKKGGESTSSDSDSGKSTTAAGKDKAAT